MSEALSGVGWNTAEKISQIRDKNKRPKLKTFLKNTQWFTEATS